MLDRPLYQPTPAEILKACEVLMMHGLPRDARDVVISKYGEANRDCAQTLMGIARRAKQRGDMAEVCRLVKNARWYWRCYIWEITR